MKIENIDFFMIEPNSEPDIDGEYYVSISVNLSDTTFKKAKLLYGVNQQSLIYYVYNMSKSTIIDKLLKLPTEFIIDDGYLLPPCIYNEYLRSSIDITLFLGANKTPHPNTDDFNNILDLMNNATSNHAILDKLIDHHSRAAVYLQSCKEDL